MEELTLKEKVIAVAAVIIFYALIIALGIVLFKGHGTIHHF
jgi:hypothetical protein